MNYHLKRKFSVGGQLATQGGAAIGASAVTAIPGVGPMLSPLGAAAGGYVGKEIAKQFGAFKTIKPPVQTMAGSNFAKGGKIHMAPGAGKYVGPKHSGGGIPVDENGNPTKRTNAVAEVEGGETVQNGYVFSDRLIVPGTEMTFAQVHEQLLAKNDTQAIEQLAQMQEQMNGGSDMNSEPVLDDGGRISRGNRRAGSTNYVQTRQQVGVSAAEVRGRSPRRAVNTRTTTRNANPLSRSINPPKVVDPLVDRLSVSNANKASSGLQEAANYKPSDFVRSTRNSVSDDVANALKRTSEINPGARAGTKVGSGVLRSAGNSVGRTVGRLTSWPVTIGSMAGLAIGEGITDDSLIGSFNRARTNYKNAEIAERNRIAATYQRDADRYRAGWDRGFPFNPVGESQLFVNNDQQFMTQAEIADIVRNNVVQNTPITSNGNESVTTTDQTPAISEAVSNFQPRTNILFSGRPEGMRLPRYVRNQFNTRQTNFMGYDDYGNIVPMTGEMPSNINESVRIEGSADTNQSITSTLGLNGTLPATNREIGTLTLPENQVSPQAKSMVEREKAKFFDTLGSVIPSALRIGAAIAVPRPQISGRMAARNLPTTSPVFQQLRRDAQAGFAASPDQGSYARYLDATSQAAAGEAEFRASREAANEQNRMQVEQTNLQLRARDQERKEQDTAARLNLVAEGIEIPIRNRMMDKAMRKKTIASIGAAAAGMPEATQAKFIERMTRLLDLEKGGRIPSTQKSARKWQY